MRFVDFDLALAARESPEAVEVRSRSGAFVRAIRVDLNGLKIDAPWRKLFVGLGDSAWFGPPHPKLGLSTASLVVADWDRAILTTAGESIRPLLAAALESGRDQLRGDGGWDDEAFWTAVRRAGRHRGAYVSRGRLPFVRDRSSGLMHELVTSWDEAGTTVAIQARRGVGDPAAVQTSLVATFPGKWEVEFDGFTPAKLRLAADRVEVVDRAGSVIATVPRGT